MSAPGRKSRRVVAAESGFGLVEMAIASAVLGLLMAGVFTMLFRAQVSYEIQSADMDVRQRGRTALDRMSTELRLAGYGMDNLTDPITRAGTNVLQLVGDIDDGDADPPCAAIFEDAANGGAERVTYQVSVGRLLRTVECWDGAAWTLEFANQVVARDLVGNQSLFRYYDSAGNELVPTGTELTAAQRDQVRLVTIDISILDTDDPIQGTYAQLELSGRVRLPNVD